MISPQLISISPTRQRPASATGTKPSTSHFAKKASPSPHSALSRKSHGGTLASTSATSGVVAASGRLQSPDSALAVNLKQQIACLEMEVKYLKQQGGSKNGAPTPGAASSAEGTRVRLGTNTSLASEGVRVGNSGAAPFSSDLYKRAEELEDEVIRLRRQYAEREQAHALELATLREELNGSGSSTHSVVHGIREEAERREKQHRHEVSSLRSLHAQEAVLLQKTVERLQMEVKSAQSHQQVLQSDKESLAREIIMLHDNLRTALANVESESKQKQEAMAQLNCEQERRRASEVKESDLRVELSGLSKGVILELETKLSEAEKAKRALQIELQAKGYELEHAKLTIEKQGKDIAQATTERLEAAAKDISVKETLSQLETKLAKAASGLADLQAEKEYYRLQTDRLKVEGAVLDVKCKQAEQQLNAERASIVALEKQYCTSLEQIEALRRDGKSKEDAYREMDHHHTEMRLHQRSLQDESNALEQQLRATRSELDALRKEYDAIRHFAEAAKREGQIQNALMRLTKTKEEMQNLLSVQARLSSDINEAMCDLPDANTISRIVTPPRRAESPSTHHQRQEQQQQQQQRQHTSVEVSASSDVAPTTLPAAAAAAVDPASIQRQMDALLKGISDQEATLPSLLGHN